MITSASMLCMMLSNCVFLVKMYNKCLNNEMEMLSCFKVWEKYTVSATQTLQVG